MNGTDDSLPEMNPRKDRLRELFARKPSVRELIAQQAADWFVANREGLDTTQSAAFAAWLRASPQNIEEYLNIVSIGRDLRAASDDPAMSFEDLMKCALEEDPIVTARPPEPPQPRVSEATRTDRHRWRAPSWLPVVVAVAAIGAVTLAFLYWQHSAPLAAGTVIAYNIQTRHGEQLTRQLPDNSVLRLDTDTFVSVRFDHAQRLVKILKGRAEFKVSQEPARQFIVQAHSLRIIDVGTEFDVDAQSDSTVVTVLEGRVAVAVDPKSASSLGTHEGHMSPASYAPIEVTAGQQVRVDEGSWPPTYTPVDTQRATAWLRHQIMFQNEPLERVAVEFNRYAPTPIEIDTPALRTLAVSGVFTADDTESFIAFLRSLDGVRVDVTPTRIRVSKK